VRPRPVVIGALGVAQILGWGSSFYFPAVLAAPVAADTGWPLAWVVGGASIGLLTGGLVSPQAGALIDRYGGRPVLAASSLFFAAGLAGIGLAPTLPAYLLAWVVVGAGMGCGLYDAVFAALGKLYGSEARIPITNLTLIGGFASTLCWPLSAVLAETVGWRGACLVYALLHLLLSLPLQMAVLPKQMPANGGPASVARPSAPPPRRPVAGGDAALLCLVAMVLTIASGIGSVVVVHLLIFLEAGGASFAAAVALGTLFGPAQVAARAIERLLGARYHPIWTMLASCGLMASGLLLLTAGPALPALAIVVYAAGYGIMWIARGTLPLALFGPERYAVLMGRLALPSLIAQALAPSGGAWLLERLGAQAVLGTLTALAAANLVLMVLLLLLFRPISKEEQGSPS
jgi:MFS family permease